MCQKTFSYNCLALDWVNWEEETIRGLPVSPPGFISIVSLLETLLSSWLDNDLPKTLIEGMKVGGMHGRGH